jgi:hypothetical protein
LLIRSGSIWLDVGPQWVKISFNFKKWLKVGLVVVVVRHLQREANFQNPKDLPMALESPVNFISDLVASNPVSTDGLQQADDHLRNIKTAVKATFPNVTGAITSTQAELNKLDGATASTAELNYVTGVTSGIQTQLNAKQATITGAATTIDDSDLTASRALISDGSGKVAVSAVTSTELGYLDGVTSNVQTQINTVTTAVNNVAGYPQVITIKTSGTSYAIPSGAQAVLIRAAGAGGGGGTRGPGSGNSNLTGSNGGNTTVTNSTLGISIDAKGGTAGNGDGTYNGALSTGDSGGDVIKGGGATGGASSGNFDITGHDGRNGNMVVKYVTGSNVGGQTLAFSLGAGGASSGTSDGEQPGESGYVEIWVW